MAYADYNFYTSVYKGTMSEAAFGRLSERASEYIDGRTEYALKKYGITEELEERVKKCCCALADTISINEQGGVKTSETIGDYHVAYPAGAQRTADQRLDDTLQLYLADLVRTVKWI